MQSIYQIQLEKLVSTFGLNEIDKNELNKPYNLYTIGTKNGDVKIKIVRGQREKIEFRFVDNSERNFKALKRIDQNINTKYNFASWHIVENSGLQALEVLYKQLVKIVPPIKK